MKAIFLFLFFFIYVFKFSTAQNPLVKMWDYRFGGTDYDGLRCFLKTKDGGNILAGLTESGISGDKIQGNWGSSDYWIVKLDSSGIKLWEKDFGGTEGDALSSIQQTLDGGFILGGSSESGISGDKTQNTWGDYDYWIVKIDSLGNKQWDKDFGGTSSDFLYSIKQTSDGGFILGGHSISGISGDKTQSTVGNYDYWILRIDSVGNKLWDKDFGGSLYDVLFSLIETNDRGFILAGASNSGISGDKSQVNWDTSSNTCDYWIIKTDSLGNLQWDKNFGGTDDDRAQCIQQSTNGGFIFGGYSRSGISGDKTQSTWGDYDYWIVKTDSMGNKEWDKDFGGTDWDRLFSISQTDDGGLFLSGESRSTISSGNKTENNLGFEQSWIIKTDSLGVIAWDKTVFSNGSDQLGLAIQTNNFCYEVVSESFAGIAGYKTQNAWNNSMDYWIVKFCDSTFFPPNASLTVSQNLCPGICTDFFNLSSNAITYQWFFPGALPDTSYAINPSNICYATPGTYSITLIASNANGSDTLTLQNYITVFPQPAPQSILQSDDTLFAIAGAASYQWYFNSDSITGATNYFYVATQSGNYNVVATDSNGCEVEAVINNVIAGNSQLAMGNLQLAIFPNPVIETLDIRGLELNSSYEISIFNVVGEKVFSAVDCKLPIGNCQLSSGMYYIEINTNNKIFRSKFLKSTN